MRWIHTLIFSTLLIPSLPLHAETSSLPDIGAYMHLGIDTNKSLIKLFKIPTTNKKHGYYSRDSITVQWIGNGRKVKLLQDITFTEPNGKKWLAPKGHIVDGASIPEIFQPFVGTPYGGKYVVASIMHDVACDEKKRSWEEVHKMFHLAMLAANVAPDKAALMYEAVYAGGPRWGEYADTKLTKEAFNQLISDGRFDTLTSDFLARNRELTLIGDLKPYSGNGIYSYKHEDNTVLGIRKNYNDSFMQVEVGNGKPNYTVGHSFTIGGETNKATTEENRRAFMEIGKPKKQDNTGELK